jgi:hypothetical protein
MSDLNVHTVSEITSEVCALYVRADNPSATDLAELASMLNAAKAFVRSYTGVDDLDTYPDFVLCVLILVQDMYDHRSFYVDKGTVNRVVESILDLHSVNLL